LFSANAAALECDVRDRADSYKLDAKCAETAAARALAKTHSEVRSIVAAHCFAEQQISCSNLRRFDESHKTWKAYLQRECEGRLKYSGGSGAGVEYLRCREALMNERVQALLWWRDQR